MVVKLGVLGVLAVTQFTIEGLVHLCQSFHQFLVLHSLSLVLLQQVVRQLLLYFQLASPLCGLLSLFQLYSKHITSPHPLSRPPYLHSPSPKPHVIVLQFKWNWIGATYQAISDMHHVHLPTALNTDLAGTCQVLYQNSIP